MPRIVVLHIADALALDTVTDNAAGAPLMRLGNVDSGANGLDVVPTDLLGVPSKGAEPVGNIVLDVYKRQDIFR